MTGEQYPASGPNLGWAFDTMGRLNTMTDLGTSSSIISGATYGPANEMLSMGGSVNETRVYNSMLQLKQMYNGAINISYNYPSSNNNGKIASQTDNVSGEQVVYTYDAVNRLATAGATSGSWGQSYSYDGFGNLTGQTVTAGSAPSYSVTPDPATNRLGSTDANGNATGTIGGGTPTYDVENRLVSIGYQNIQYGYAPGNKRVWRGLWTLDPGTSMMVLTTDEVTFWSAGGQKLATYWLSTGTTTASCYPNYWQTCFTSTLVASQVGTNYYFGGKLIKNASGYVGADRLGSIGHYYPYGQEKPSATTNGTEKFTGYFRDSETGLDYADQRFHSPGTGRFLSPDPYMASGGAANPGSWNRYAYVQGDPINHKDHTGKVLDSEACVELGWCDDGGEDPDPGPPSGSVCGANQHYDPSIQACVDDEPENPLCIISVFNRPIEATHGLNIPGAQHGYILFTVVNPDDSVNTFYFEGAKDGSTLTAIDTSSGGTHLSSDVPSKNHWDGTMSGEDICSWLSILQQAASDVNAADIKYHVLGPNSTTALVYMLSNLPQTSWVNLPFMVGATSTLPGL
jgi:RHS repeat-associated protein